MTLAACHVSLATWYLSRAMSQDSTGSVEAFDASLVISQFQHSTLNENPIFEQFTWTKRADGFIIDHVRSEEDRNITWITGPGGSGKSTWATFHVKENSAIKLALSSDRDFDNLAVISRLGCLGCLRADMSELYSIEGVWVFASSSWLSSTSTRNARFALFLSSSSIFHERRAL